MTGKNKCKILKDIRRQIAENNDIELIIEECTYKGECTGTCPKCEEELRYLEAELLKRKNAGKSIAVAGLAAVMLATSGCANEPVKSNAEHKIISSSSKKTQSSASSSETDENDKPMGEIPVDSENYNSVYELEGDVAYPSESYEIEGSITAYTSTSTSSNNTSTKAINTRSDIRDSSRTMGMPRQNDRPEIKVNVSSKTAEKEVGPALDINHLFKLSERQRKDYLADYTRMQIIKAWNTSEDMYSFETQSGCDIFLVLHKGINYELKFCYDSESFVVDHSIKVAG